MLLLAVAVWSGILWARYATWDLMDLGQRQRSLGPQSLMTHGWMQLVGRHLGGDGGRFPVDRLERCGRRDRCIERRAGEDAFEEGT